MFLALCSVSDGVAVGDALSGSALIVLEADGAPRCLRARVGAGAAAAAEEEEPRVAPLAAGAGSGTPAAGSSAAASAAAVEKDVEAHVARVYGDLLAGVLFCQSWGRLGEGAGYLRCAATPCLLLFLVLKELSIAVILRRLQAPAARLCPLRPPAPAEPATPQASAT